MIKPLISVSLYIIGGLILISYFNIEIKSFIDFIVWMTGLVTFGLGGIIQSKNKVK